jgi:hypothetical protein
MTEAMREAMSRDPVGANLASLNEIIAEMMQALADHGVGEQEFADLVRVTLRDHSHSLGWAFQGEVDFSAAVPRETP